MEVMIVILGKILGEVTRLRFGPPSQISEFLANAARILAGLRWRCFRRENDSNDCSLRQHCAILKYNYTILNSTAISHWVRTKKNRSSSTPILPKLPPHYQRYISYTIRPRCWLRLMRSVA